VRGGSEDRVAGDGKSPARGGQEDPAAAGWKGSALSAGIALALVLTGCGGGPGADQTPTTDGEEALEDPVAVGALHDEALVWDAHNDLAYRVLYEGLDIGQRLPAGHVDLPRLEEGRVDVQTVALFVENFLYPHPG